jgi:hypothetical protein
VAVGARPSLSSNAPAPVGQLATRACRRSSSSASSAAVPARTRARSSQALIECAFSPGEPSPPACAAARARRRPETALRGCIDPSRVGGAGWQGAEGSAGPPASGAGSRPDRGRSRRSPVRRKCSALLPRGAAGDGQNPPGGHDRRGPGECAPGAAWLSKPFGLEELQAAVEQAMRSAMTLPGSQTTSVAPSTGA